MAEEELVQPRGWAESMDPRGKETEVTTVEFRIVDEATRQTWNQLATSFPEGSVFHSWEWMEVAGELYNAQPLPVGIFQGEEMVGIYPLFRKRKGPLTLLMSPVGTIGYGGPLAPQELLPEILAQQGELAQRFGADTMDIRSLNNGLQPRFAAEGYELEGLKTIVLALETDVDALWSNLKPVCRTAVRRARKKGVVIQEAQDKSYLDVYYDMALDTYAKSNRLPPVSRQEYEMVWDRLHPRGMLKVLLAMHEEQILAGITLFRFGGRIYYWDGAAYRRFYPFNANNLLHWAAIEEAVAEGMTAYDMLGANIPSIARFKKSFGGEIVPYTLARKDLSQRAQLGRQLYFWVAPRVRRAQFWIQARREQLEEALR